MLLVFVGENLILIGDINMIKDLECMWYERRLRKVGMSALLKRRLGEGAARMGME